MQRIKKSETIAPAGGLILPPRFRERRPPRIGGTGRLKGRIRWALERGGQVVQEGYQDNLITDAGLDNFASSSSPSDSTKGDLYLEHFRKVGAIGEGSVAPDVSDINLGSEVMAATGAHFSNSHTLVGDNQESSITLSYVFNITGNFNLTEFGFRPSGTGKNLSIRQLFYEADGVTPATVTVLTDDRLTLYHELDITLGPVGPNIATSLDINEYDRDGNLLGTTTYNGWHTWFGRSTQPELDRIGAFSPGPVDAFWGGMTVETSALAACTPVASGFARNGSVARAAYSDGAHSVVRGFYLTADQLNQTWYGFKCAFYTGGSSNANGGMQFVIDPASATPTFIKANTHTFSVNLTSSWARA